MYNSVIHSAYRELYDLQQAYGPMPSYDDLLWYGLSFYRIQEHHPGNHTPDPGPPKDCYTWNQQWWKGAHDCRDAPQETPCGCATCTPCPDPPPPTPPKGQQWLRVAEQIFDFCWKDGWDHKIRDKGQCSGGLWFDESKA